MGSADNESITHSCKTSTTHTLLVARHSLLVTHSCWPIGNRYGHRPLDALGRLLIVIVRCSSSSSINRRSNRSLMLKPCGPPHTHRTSGQGIHRFTY